MISYLVKVQRLLKVKNRKLFQYRYQEFLLIRICTVNYITQLEALFCVKKHCNLRLEDNYFVCQWKSTSLFLATTMATRRSGKGQERRLVMLLVSSKEIGSHESCISLGGLVHRTTGATSGSGAASYTTPGKMLQLNEQRCMTCSDDNVLILCVSGLIFLWWVDLVRWTILVEEWTLSCLQLVVDSWIFSFVFFPIFSVGVNISNGIVTFRLHV